LRKPIHFITLGHTQSKTKAPTAPQQQQQQQLTGQQKLQQQQEQQSQATIKINAIKTHGTKGS